MNIATIIFTYNRSEHTKKVLDALANNTVLPSKLFIYQDGLKNDNHRSEWEKVNDIINSATFCDTEIIVSNKNKGLANSLSEGITEVIANYDAVIVLEDDCVPMPLFMEYMICNLEKYRDYNDVYQISAWTPAIDIKDNGKDVFCAGRAESWGWATWKNKWKIFSRDYTILGRIKNDEQMNRQLDIWGQDLECYLLGNVYGKCDSWATFWALNIIEKKGVCIYPYRSLVYNIGFDGSGVHCGNEEVLGRELCRDTSKKFHLIDDIVIQKDCEKEFQKVYKWYSAEFRNGYYNKICQKWIRCKIKGCGLQDILGKHNIQKISIWGTGAIFELIIEDLGGEICVVNVIETIPSKREYYGFLVCAPSEIEKNIDAIIIIPGFDIEYIRELVPLECRNKLVTLDNLLNMEE